MFAIKEGLEERKLEKEKEAENNKDKNEAAANKKIRSRRAPKVADKEEVANEVEPKVEQ